MSALQTSLRRAAGRVWWDMAGAENLKLFLNEETITESLLLFLGRRHQGNGLFIRPYSKPKEKRTGTDWEWCFAFRGRCITMRVQAKRLYKTKRYNALDMTGRQIDTLIRMAGTTHPIYVFYNDALHGGQVLSARPAHALRCGSFRGPSHWGCMITHARQVKGIGSNKMTDLLPVSMPWHCLLCPLSVKRGGRSLPDVVAANLNLIVADTDGIGVRLMEPPMWAMRLMADRPIAERDGRSDDPELDRYLGEHDLAGVVVFHGDGEQE